MPSVRPVKSWVVPVMAVEQLPAGVGAVFLTYQLPVCPVRFSVAVVAATGLALNAASVLNVAAANSSALLQFALL